MGTLGPGHGVVSGTSLGCPQPSRLAETPGSAKGSGGLSGAGAHGTRSGARGGEQQQLQKQCGQQRHTPAPALQEGPLFDARVTAATRLRLRFGPCGLPSAHVACAAPHFSARRRTGTNGSRDAPSRAGQACRGALRQQHVTSADGMQSGTGAREIAAGGVRTAPREGPNAGATRDIETCTQQQCRLKDCVR